jgi:hypothetical protein
LGRQYFCFCLDNSLSFTPLVKCQNVWTSILSFSIQLICSKETNTVDFNTPGLPSTQLHLQALSLMTSVLPNHVTTCQNSYSNRVLFGHWPHPNSTPPFPKEHHLACPVADESQDAFSAISSIINPPRTLFLRTQNPGEKGSRKWILLSAALRRLTAFILYFFLPIDSFSNGDKGKGHRS